MLSTIPMVCTVKGGKDLIDAALMRAFGFDKDEQVGNMHE
jgi:hypothetical protein